MSAGAAPPTLVALVACFAFAFPNQMLDIYRDIAQTIVLGPLSPETGILGHASVWRELVQSAIAVAALSASLWLASVVLVQQRRRQDAAMCRPAVVTSQIIPIVLGLAPVVMLAVGLLSARVASSTELEIAARVKDTFLAFGLELGLTKEMAETLANDFASRLVGYNARLAQYAIGVGVLALALLALFIFLQSRAAAPAVVRLRLRLGWLTAPVYATVIAAVIIAVSLVVADYPVRFAEYLRPIPIFCLFCILLLFAMDAMRWFSHRTGLPLIAITVVVAAAFALADLNDNHAVRYETVASGSAAPALPQARDEFRTWLSGREDRAAYSGERGYPVYIVAAQGGGIYAAYHAASFLAAMQRACPNFAHHLFAISGVSGGSVGAAIFNAMMREAETQKKVVVPESGCSTSVENTGPAYSEAVHSVLDEDLWSPLQAALLFPDFLQRFLFWPVPKFDRALALERGLEKAWLGMMNEERFFNPARQRITRNYLADPYARHWAPQRFKNVPALMLNTTEVGTGHRRLIAPFQFPGTGTLNFFPVEIVSEQGKPEHLPLSTAAALSARFPWVTPLGWISGTAAGAKDGIKVRVVDGGYFENSGVATALDLIKELSAFVGADGTEQKIEINLIVLSSADFSPERWAGTGETLGPIQTMLNTRTARGLIEIERAKQELRTMNTDRTRFRPIEIKLRGYGYPLPLGWRLSRATRYLIESQRGVRSKCTGGPVGDAADGGVDCAKELLFRQLWHGRTQ